jgi:hypothetical protein
VISTSIHGVHRLLDQVLSPRVDVIVLCHVDRPVVGVHGFRHTHEVQLLQLLPDRADLGGTLERIRRTRVELRYDQILQGRFHFWRKAFHNTFALFRHFFSYWSPQSSVRERGFNTRYTIFNWIDAVSVVRSTNVVDPPRPNEDAICDDPSHIQATHGLINELEAFLPHKSPW